MSNRLTLCALRDIPLVKAGDDLCSLIMRSLRIEDLALEDNDVLVIAQKIVSKSEGRLVKLDSVTPSRRAQELADITLKDPRLVELILSESTEVTRATKGLGPDKQGLLIVRHRLGFVLANAGVDMSNVGQIEDGPAALLLPIDADASCRWLRERFYNEAGVQVGMIINDSHGRAWRNGVVGSCIGVAGVPAVQDLRGSPDLFGRTLQTTVVATADELSAAASILMGQSNGGTPVVHIRGLGLTQRDSRVSELIRTKECDLFP